MFLIWKLLIVTPSCVQMKMLHVILHAVDCSQSLQILSFLLRGYIKKQPANPKFFHDC